MDSKQVSWPGWETTRLIGHGSFGAVYEIQREIRGRTEHAALKVISIPHNESEIYELKADGYDDESITQYFADSLEKIEEEYAMMADLKGHSNVVYCDDIRTVQHDDGFGWDIYIKMELLTPLKSYLSDKVTDAQVIKLGMDICDALKLCEDLNIVHRDIKPENIFVSRNGNYKLGDFGIAKTMEGTTGGTKTGTYDYMSPEVYNNFPYHTQTDIYSLGLVMYWLLNNRTAPFLPTKGKKPTPSEKSIARDRRFSGERILAPLYGSERLQEIVLKACAYDPKDRYQSAAEMLADLKVQQGGSAPAVIPQQETEIQNEMDDLILETEATIGPGSEKIPVDLRLDEDETVGPNFNPVSVDETADQEKTVGPVFVPKDKPKQPKKKKKVWPVIAVFVVLFMAVVLGNQIGNSQDAWDSSPIASFRLTIEDVEQFRNRVAFSNGIFVGVKDDGTVFCKSYDESIEMAVSCWTHVKQVGISNGTVYGLREDGTVCFEGYSYNPSLETASNVDSFAGSWARFASKPYGVDAEGKLIVPEDDPLYSWTDIIDVCADYWAVGLRRDGTVICIDGEGNPVSDFYSNWSGIKALARSPYGVVGLQSNGTLICDAESFKTSECSKWTDLVAVSGQDSWIVGLKNDGTVVADGDNSAFQCEVSEWENVVYVYTGVYGANCTMGLKADGTLVTTLSGLKEEIESWDNITKINSAYTYYAGYTAVGITSDGKIVGAGCEDFSEIANSLYNNAGGKIGDVLIRDPFFFHFEAIGTNGRIIPFTKNSNTFYDTVPYDQLHNVVSGTAGAYLLENGRVNVTDYNRMNAEKAIPTEIIDGVEVAKDWKNIVDIACDEQSYGCLYGLKADGTIISDSGIVCNEGSVADLLYGSYDSLFALKKDGTVYSNVTGEWQNWTNIVSADVARAGTDYIVASITDDGRVCISGNNSLGQCNVSEWIDIVQLSVTPVCTLGLTANGTVVVAGLNELTNIDLGLGE